MEIIDSHAHIYPERIAEKATEAVSKFYNLPMELTAGTSDNLIILGKQAGISRFVVHSVATTAHQVRSINSFIKDQMDLHKELIGFMTLHEDLTEEEIEKELDWCISNGFKGVKLHPDFQKFYIDSDNAEKLYRIIGDRLPILMHVGDDKRDYSQLERLVKVAKNHPKVTFIAAHLGGYLSWDKAHLYKGLNNVYFDTCSSLPFISPEKAKSIIEMLGEDRFFFSTDFPMWDAKSELERFNKIDLTESQRQKILSSNIKKLLKI